MRLVAATLTLTASAALGVLSPAQAGEVTVDIPILHCRVSASTNDFYFSANSRRVNFERSGYNSFHQTCVS